MSAPSARSCACRVAGSLPARHSAIWCPSQSVSTPLSFGTCRHRGCAFGTSLRSLQFAGLPRTAAPQRSPCHIASDVYTRVRMIGHNCFGYRQCRLRHKELRSAAKQAPCRGDWRFQQQQKRGFPGILPGSGRDGAQRRRGARSRSPIAPRTPSAAGPTASRAGLAWLPAAAPAALRGAQNSIWNEFSGQIARYLRGSRAKGGAMLRCRQAVPAGREAARQP